MRGGEGVAHRADLRSVETIGQWLHCRGELLLAYGRREAIVDEVTVFLRLETGSHVKIGSHIDNTIAWRYVDWHTETNPPYKRNTLAALRSKGVCSGSVRF
jgi:hypothetical protein